MSLPVELRTMVYRELLIVDGLIVMGYNDSTFVIAVPNNEVMPDHNPHQFTPVNPLVDSSALLSILRVSNPIHQEAFHLLPRQHILFQRHSQPHGFSISH